MRAVILIGLGVGSSRERRRWQGEPKPTLRRKEGAHLALERRRLEAKTALPFMATRAVTTARGDALQGGLAQMFTPPPPRFSRSSSSPAPTGSSPTPACLYTARSTLPGAGLRPPQAAHHVQHGPVLLISNKPAGSSPVRRLSCCVQRLPQAARAPFERPAFGPSAPITQPRMEGTHVQV